ncbi:MAG: H-X9-DG-CTERM domain-containing protein [Armatimonadota bacterium]
MPDNPDYFFVAGSFLSGVAIAEVKKPSSAPMLSDLVNPSKNVPYVKDDGDNDPDIAVATVDPRHNKGAVFAFADGHVAWVQAKSINTSLFIYSLGTSGTGKPPIFGDVFSWYAGHPNNYRFTNIQEQIVMQTELTELTYCAGTTQAVGSTTLKTMTLKSSSNDATNLPPWLDKTQTLAGQVNTPLTVTNFALKWGTQGPFAPLAGVKGTGPKTATVNLTIVPSTTTGQKRVGIGAYRTMPLNKDPSLNYAYALINNITVGTGPTAKVYPVNKKITLHMDNFADAGMALVMVSPVAGQPITFNVTCAYTSPDPADGGYWLNNVNYSIGLWLMFEE